MSPLNPESELALKQTLAVWELMLKEDIRKPEAMKQLFPEYFNRISCNCFLCEYTKPFVEPSNESTEYNCEYCPAQLNCDESYSPYLLHGDADLAVRQQARQTIINRCKTALAHEVE